MSSSFFVFFLLPLNTNKYDFLIRIITLGFIMMLLSDIRKLPDKST